MVDEVFLQFFVGLAAVSRITKALMVFPFTVGFPDDRRLSHRIVGDGALDLYSADVCPAATIRSSARPMTMM